MEYRVIRHDDYLAHRHEAGAGTAGSSSLANKGKGRKKGFQLDEHLYKARAWIGGKWRYAYTNAQLAAMNAWGKGRQAARDVKKAASNAYGEAKKVASGKYAEDVRNRQKSGEYKMHTAVELRKQSRDAQRRGATEAAEGGKRHAKQLYDEGNYEAASAARERSSLKYKISDLLGGGLDSETARNVITRGKNITSGLLNRGHNVLRNGKKLADATLKDVSSYASKGKEFIQSLPDWGKTKAQNANAMVKEKTGVDVWDTAKRAGNKVKTEITEKPEHLKNVYEKARSDAGDIAREAATSVKNAGKAAWDYAKPGGTFDQKYVQALEKIPGGSKVVSLANSAKATADKLSDSIADFARSNYRYATDSDYRKLTKEVKTAQKQLSDVQSIIAKIKAESAKLGPYELPEDYNDIYKLQELELELTGQISRANSALDKYDED